METQAYTDPDGLFRFGKVKSILSDPGMYTLSGTFEEVVCYLEAWYYALTRASIDAPDGYVWRNFQQWLAEELRVSRSDVFRHIRDTMPEDKLAFLTSKWDEYEQLLYTDSSPWIVHTVNRAIEIFPEQHTRTVLSDIMIRDRIPAIISNLSLIQQRPRMYVGAGDGVHLIQILLSGIQIGCRALGCSYEIEDERRAMQQHGWERHADGTITQMRERGLTEMQMVHDLLEIEKDSWRNYHARLGGENRRPILETPDGDNPSRKINRACRSGAGDFRGVGEA
jgi:hypothetical protein